MSKHVDNNLVGVKSPCFACNGQCCHWESSSNDYSVLLEDGEESRFKGEAIQVTECGVKLWVIPRKNKRCVFLSKDNRCTIYSRRPQGCRDFQCTRLYHKSGDVNRHGMFLRENPDVVKLIELMIAGQLAGPRT